MAFQTKLEHYFNSRKRQSVDDFKKVNEKVRILEKNESDTPKEVDFNQRAIIYVESPKSSSSKLTTAPKLPKRTPKTVPRCIITCRQSSTIKTSAKKSLLTSFNATKLEENEKNKTKFPSKENTKKALIASFDATETKEKDFKEINSIKGLNVNETAIVSVHIAEERNIGKIATEIATEEPIKSSSQTNSTNKALDKLDNYNKDLNLNALKKKLIKSSRLDDLRNALKKVNEGHNKLKEIQSRNAKTPIKSPTLSHFKAIEVEVSSSPSKMCSAPIENPSVPDSPSLLRRAVFLSPSKTASNSQPYISPKKLFSDSFASALQKSPDTSTSKHRSFERFYALASSGKPAFTLPYHYRSLAETFRALDTVVSIMQNRGEVAVFSKVKSSVQQLSKKNLNESHLGQIATVFPKAYSFVQEKVRVLGNQNETYELVIKPTFENRETNNDSVKELMTPSLLLERKRQFYNSLVEIVKIYHEEFLKTLDPPLEVPKEKLTRWHPAFDVESCTEIKAALLPQPPNTEKYTTAKDVLNKARDLFVVNPRMEKALERLSENKTSSTATAKSIPALAKALKGIPKSLLEKVRARQAAKAIELLTRNPEENKRRYELTRLPELARILRSIFVTEKKNIIAKPVIIQKMCESYREIIDQTEMAHHLDLLRETVPGWIFINVVENKEFVKLCKQTDLTEVLNKINQLIAQNKLNL